jgi:hypothetical protein
MCLGKGRQYSLNTYIDDPILWAVRVGATHVQAPSVSHRLNHSYVVSAVEML